MVIISLDRNPEAQWATGFGVHGVVVALRICNDLIWLLQHDASSDCIKMSRCLHPMERCALQGFQAEQLAGMSKAGVLRAKGDACCARRVAAVLKRCMEVLVARGHRFRGHVVAPRPSSQQCLQYCEKGRERERERGREREKLERERE